jgi:hypothetical protein
MALLDFLKQKTKVYDPSENSLSIAGLELDAITRIVVTHQPMNKIIEGTHSSYATVIRRHLQPIIITVNIMPSAACMPKVMQLYQYVKEYGCFFDLVVKRSGDIVFQGSSTFEKKNDYDIQNESSDYTFTFICNAHGSPTESVAIVGDFDISDFTESDSEVIN